MSGYLGLINLNVTRDAIMQSAGIHLQQFFMLCKEGKNQQLYRGSLKLYPVVSRKNKAKGLRLGDVRGRELMHDGCGTAICIFSLALMHTSHFPIMIFEPNLDEI